MEEGPLPRARATPCCCGISLQTGVKILAMILILKDIFGIFFYASTVVEDFGKAEEEDYLEPAIYKWILFYTAVFLFTSLDIVMAIILYIGATLGKASYCRNWFRYGSVVLIFSAVILVDAVLTTNMDPISMSIGGIPFVIYGYTLLLVGSLKEDLQARKEVVGRLIERIDVVLEDFERRSPTCPVVINCLGPIQGQAGQAGQTV